MIPKFRAWTGTEMRCDIVGIDWDESFGVHNAWLGNNIEYNADNFLMNVVLMQYTGLKDKNGVEIYEGDIITYECDEGYGFETVKTKVGKFPAFDIEVGYRDYDLTPIYFAIEEYWDFKVIGNIYENPELIE